MRVTIAIVLGLCLLLQVSALAAQESPPPPPDAPSQSERQRPSDRGRPSERDRAQRPGAADDDESESSLTRRRRARRSRDRELAGDYFVSEEAGVRIPWPQGWRDAQPLRDSLVILLAPGQVSAQFEVRVSRGISPRNREQFLTTFHNNLRRAGMREIERREDVRRGEHVGNEVEYAVASNDQAFRLIVWILWRGDDAWIFSAFMPERRRDAIYRTFSRMLRGVEFTER